MQVEENVAHDDELKAQTDYEDSMQALKTEEANLQAQLAENRKLLADKEQELLEKKKDLKVTHTHTLCVWVTSTVTHAQRRCAVGSLKATPFSIKFGHEGDSCKVHLRVLL